MLSTCLRNTFLCAPWELEAKNGTYTYLASLSALQPRLAGPVSKFDLAVHSEVDSCEHVSLAPVHRPEKNALCQCARRVGEAGTHPTSTGNGPRKWTDSNEKELEKRQGKAE